MSTNKRTSLQDSNPSYSVVIPAFNEENFIGACLSSLLAQDTREPFEVVVCDNNSTDNTINVVESYGARVVKENNRGVCAARQTGMAAARAPIIISTDADTTFNASWLSKISEQFKEHPNAVAIAGTPKFVDAPFWGTLMTESFIRVVQVIYRLTNKPIYVSAANLAFRRTAFTAYNTKLTQGGDELDVLRQLKKSGNVVVDMNNPVFTSSRRLYQGFIYNTIVTMFLYYILDYNLSRFTGRSLLGSFPAFRNNNYKLNHKRNMLFGAVAMLLIFAVLYYWHHNQLIVRKFDSRMHMLESKIRSQYKSNAE